MHRWWRFDLQLWQIISIRHGREIIDFSGDSAMMGNSWRMIKWRRSIPFSSYIIYNQNCSPPWLLTEDFIRALLADNASFNIEHSHLIACTPHICSRRWGLMARDSGCAGPCSFPVRPPDLPHDMHHAGLFGSASPVNTDRGMRSTFAPVVLNSQTSATQHDKQQMCHTGWNQNSRPAWSCAHHQTWLLWWGGEAASAAGRWDKAAPLLLPASCLEEDRPVCRLLWHS